MTVFPNTELEASGTEVGLPKGQVGNSEVGHMTIGSGRINPQPLTYINEKIKTKEFFENEVLDNMINYVKEKDSTLHLVGLLSNGGVHSSANHFYAALAMAKLKKVKKVLDDYCEGKDIGIKIVMLKEFSNDLNEILDMYKNTVYDYLLEDDDLIVSIDDL